MSIVNILTVMILLNSTGTAAVTEDYDIPPPGPPRQAPQSKSQGQFNTIVYFPSFSFCDLLIILRYGYKVRFGGTAMVLQSYFAVTKIVILLCSSFFCLSMKNKILKKEKVNKLTIFCIIQDMKQR